MDAVQILPTILNLYYVYLKLKTKTAPTEEVDNREDIKHGLRLYL
jgi:hypothetical protein